MTMDMTENKSWTVVQFSDDTDEGVAEVPSNWIKNDNCYWPNLTQTQLVLMPLEIVIHLMKTEHAIK